MTTRMLQNRTPPQSRSIDVDHRTDSTGTRTRELDTNIKVLTSRLWTHQKHLTHTMRRTTQNDTECSGRIAEEQR
jgi:hypothetical protein